MLIERLLVIPLQDKDECVIAASTSGKDEGESTGKYTVTYRHTMRFQFFRKSRP